MSRTVIVRYRTHPEAVAENVRLVQAVYAALNQSKPAGFRYATHQLDDGTTFVHIATVADGAENPLGSIPEFAEFQRELGPRCAEPPAAGTATLVGSYRSEN